MNSEVPLIAGDDDDDDDDGDDDDNDDSIDLYLSIRCTVKYNRKHTVTF